MVALITGGSGSGKSAFAERLLCSLGPGPRYYLATMRPFGAEAQVRIARHRRLRQDRGFSATLECPDGLSDLAVPPDGLLLLEDLSNLLANRRFSPSPCPDCAGALWEELEALIARSRHLVVVSNEIFSDGVDYDADTADYVRLLGDLNRRLARRADLVAEVVCGLPLVLKGELPCLIP